MLNLCPSCNETREGDFCPNCQGIVLPAPTPKHYRMQVDLGDVLRTVPEHPRLICVDCDEELSHVCLRCTETKASDEEVAQALVELPDPNFNPSFALWVVRMVRAAEAKVQ